MIHVVKLLWFFFRLTLTGTSRLPQCQWSKPAWWWVQSMTMTKVMNQSTTHHARCDTCKSHEIKTQIIACKTYLYAPTPVTAALGIADSNINLHGARKQRRLEIYLSERQRSQVCCARQVRCADLETSSSCMSPAISSKRPQPHTPSTNSAIERGFIHGHRCEIKPRMVKLTCQKMWHTVHISLCFVFDSVSTDFIQIPSRALDSHNTLTIAKGSNPIEYLDGLVQERRNSSALAMELRLSCIYPSMCGLVYDCTRSSYVGHP